MRYARLTVDGEGETHFEDAKLEMNEADYRPPAPLVFVSHARESSMVQFVRLPAGWAGKSFKVPEPQFLIPVQGDIAITVSDGASRRFRVGDVTLMEDNRGKGHSTRVIGDADCVAAVAPVID